MIHSDTFLSGKRNKILPLELETIFRIHLWPCKKYEQEKILREVRNVEVGHLEH